MEAQRRKKFLELLDRYKNIVARVCSVYSSAQTPFADLYQEVMINLWTGLDTWRGDAKVSTWIYRVALNTCITFHRKAVKNTTVSLDNTFDRPDLPETGNQDRMDLLYVFIGRLNKVDKALITLWLDEKPYDEIALIMGISKTNVATRLNRIRKKLSEMFEKEEGE